jgi:hypothetical protein
MLGFQPLGFGINANRFNPLATSGATIFYYEVKAAGDAASLVDLGPNGYTLTQAVSGARPTFTAVNAAFGGQPTLTSDGVNDELVSATMPLTAPGTSPRWYWFIFSQVVWTGGCLFGGGGGSNHIVFGNTSSPNIRAFNGAAGPLNAGAPISSAKRGILRLGNAVTDQLTIGSVATATGAAYGNNSGTGFALFSGNGGAFGQYSLNRILCKAGVPSAADLNYLDTGAAALFGAGVLA